jgi:hypothetical protein
MQFNQHIHHFFVFFSKFFCVVLVFSGDEVWHICSLHWNKNITGSFVGGGFWWCGVIAFVQSWWVTSCSHPVLGWPNRCSVAMVITATGSNWAVAVCMGYGGVKSHPSTTSFCLMVSYGSQVMSCNIAWAGRFSRLIRSMVL